MEKVIIIGAGPCGLSAAIELKKRGIEPLLIEKGSVVHSIYQYPTYMRFFSTPELLEIGDIPFVTPNDKPFRNEALEYYRTVAVRWELRINTYESAEAIEPSDGRFIIRTKHRSGESFVYETENVVASTGYFDHPNMLGIPGEQLSKVSHLFREAHPYYGTKVAIIGGNNSAVDAAMELTRIGVDVTVVHRGTEISGNIKSWVRPLFESAVSKGRIKLMLESQVRSIQERSITVDTKGEMIELENDFVLALTGFRPDRSILARVGIVVDEESLKPKFNPETMESNIPGLYVAGVIASGRDANEVFIETGRHHGKLIAEHIAEK